MTTYKPLLKGSSDFYHLFLNVLYLWTDQAYVICASSFFNGKKK